MRRTVTVLLVITLGLVLASDAFADNEPKSSEELARELIEITGGSALAEQIMQAMSVHLRSAFPSVPEDLWSQLSSSLDADELARLMVPIYTKHYSHEDLTALLAFYRTPLGQRMIQSAPAIMQESIAVGEAWGQRKSVELLERLEARGYKPAEI